MRNTSKIASGISALTLLVTLAPQQAFANVCVYRPPNVRQVQGNVSDISNQPIPDVIVRVTQGKKTVASATTDSNGSFRFNSLQDGEYELKLDAPGFQRAGYLVKLNRQSKHWSRALRIKLAVGFNQCEGSIDVVKQASIR